MSKKKKLTKEEIAKLREWKLKQQGKLIKK